jgi:hypothetical protein
MLAAGAGAAVSAPCAMRRALHLGLTRALRRRLTQPAGQGQADDGPHHQQQDNAQGEGTYHGGSGAASARARRMGSRLSCGLRVWRSSSASKTW